MEDLSNSKIEAPSNIFEKAMDDVWHYTLILSNGKFLRITNIDEVIDFHGESFICFDKESIEGDPLEYMGIDVGRPRRGMVNLKDVIGVYEADS